MVPTRYRNFGRAGFAGNRRSLHLVPADVVEARVAVDLISMAIFLDVDDAVDFFDRGHTRKGLVNPCVSERFYTTLVDMSREHVP